MRVVPCPACRQLMVPRVDSHLWDCPDCHYQVTDLGGLMAGGPIPRQTLGGDWGGATAMPPTRLREGDQRVQPSAGIEWSDTTFPTMSGSPSPSGTDEAHPANPRQDQAELRRIRTEAKAKQSEAELRARTLLVEVIGEPAVQTLEAGGTYAVPSVRWPGTEYHIPKQGFIKIVKGGLWQEVCLVSSDHALPWADVVLSRIKMIEANETIVQGRGIRQKFSPNRTLDHLRETMEKLLNSQRHT